MKKDIESILKQLTAMHGKPRVELNYSNPLELTIAVVLSAQCTDERVNRVTEHLFKKYTKWQDYVDAPSQKLEEDIRSTGFYRNKAKSLKFIAGEIQNRFGGTVPDDIDTFASVKGMGRKSANMIVGLIYGKPAIIVDTHMSRVANRIGFTTNSDAEKIEVDLRRDVPGKVWTDFSLLMIIHGRYVCKARKQDCPNCLLRDYCDYYLGGRREDV
jgi:endonuclease III